MALKLLLVEDDPAIQRMYSYMFSRAGFDVQTANDGTIVYETILLNRPDIVVMDVMMPNFNGLTTLKELKANPKTQSVPVVMLSAYNDKDLVRQALKLGAAKYILKSSMEPEELVKTIKAVATGIKA